MSRFFIGMTKGFYHRELTPEDVRDHFAEIRDTAQRHAALRYPRNCETPIAADLVLAAVTGTPVRMELDFLHAGPPQWDIDVETDAGRLSLSKGGAEMAVDGKRVAPELQGREYPDLYRHFAAVVRGHSVDVDVRPLQLVADAFLSGHRVEVDPFVD